MENPSSGEGEKKKNREMEERTSRDSSAPSRSFPSSPLSNSPHLLFSAGDLSGDIHSARLAREVLRRHPDWKISALGGAHLRDAGAAILRDTSGYGVIGVAAALFLLPGIPRLKRQLVQFLQTHKIEAAVLCDWGAFNIHLARLLQEFDVPILYYFPPGSWRKTGESGNHIVPYVECVATPFEWSAARLTSAGAKAEWVGHPLLEIVDETTQEYSRAKCRLEFGAKDGEQLIAVLAGSRKMELNLLAPKLARTIRMLQQKNSRLKFVVAASRGTTARIRRYISAEIAVVENRTTEVLLAADAAIVKSGTATLEAAVCDVPQIVVYDVPLLLRAQWYLTGMHKKVFAIAMPNIIIGQRLIPELIAWDCKPPIIAAALKNLLESATQRDAQHAAYAKVRNALGAQLPYTATHRTADMLEEMLHS